MASGPECWPRSTSATRSWPSGWDGSCGELVRRPSSIGPASRRVSLETFERIDVLGARDFTLTLTAAAKARGWDAAFGPSVLRLDANLGRGYSLGLGAAHKDTETGNSTHEEDQSGRGERHSPATNDLPITMRLAEPPEPFDWLRSA